MSVSAMAESRKCAVVRLRKARRGITGRCAALVKEQRARIYILRRCATMLLCCCTVHGTGFSCTISSVGRTGCIMAGVASDCSLEKAQLDDLLLFSFFFVSALVVLRWTKEASCIIYNYCC
ncbi:unnamed protein product [Musa acuminata subsp. malaccensis]|uniref:(wild Malaysian banana) hypothetical protein n=1 Tax=Musa acuminata subsp. malaccensis TaxID=214687 RepID=A0A804J831_MUSAM|nr:PREDICTED: uncharacterized protein LOC103985539 [Musa acuminata subsp. malaccensis]CAG1839460.1 unnamed protein product [Musa acuminata subsp. malaccensis]